MKENVMLVFAMVVAAAILCAGCATGQSGEIAAGILQGVGAGLSGL